MAGIFASPLVEPVRPVARIAARVGNSQHAHYVALDGVEEDEGKPPKWEAPDACVDPWVGPSLARAGDAAEQGERAFELPHETGRRTRVALVVPGLGVPCLCERFR